jgi:hypothetical protein
MRRQPPSEIDDEQDVEDWLADEGELDWFDQVGDEEQAAEWPQAEQTRTGLVRPPVRNPARPAPEAVERRRRLLFLGALAAGFALLIVVIVVATSGGGDGGSATPATTDLTTQPATSPETTPTTTPSTTPTTTQSLKVTVPEGGSLSIGDNGDDVLTLQKALTSLKFYDGDLDSDFGTGTQTAVIAFQEAHNLKPDGIVGPDTAGAINEALAGSG